MLFDVQAELAEVLQQAAPLATPATLATNRAGPGPVSQLSRVSQGHPAGKEADPFRDDGKESTLSLSAPHPEIALTSPDPTGAARFPYGIAPYGNPRTWTGRIVSLDDWRSLSEWDRHGSTGKLWSALSGRWEATGERR
jgi:hypothetical protein